MNLLDLVNQLTEKGVRVEVAFDQKTILQFMAWGVAAAIVSSLVIAFMRKALHV